jgi:acylglycerol lipase
MKRWERGARFFLNLSLWLALSLILTQCSSMKKGTHSAEKRTPHWHDQGAERGWVADDGKEMPYQVWPAAGEKKPRAIILCVHGLSGAASDFWPLGQELPPAGIQVYGLQLRGQGSDPVVRERGTIRHARQWWNDVQSFHTLLRQRHPQTPIFWLGESLGSLITMHALTESAPPRDVSGYIVLAPPVRLRPTLPQWPVFFLRPLMSLLPGLRVDLRTLGGGVGGQMQITSESTQTSQAPLTPHFVPRQSFAVLREVSRQMRTASLCAEQLTLPVLMLYTPNDPVTAAADMESWYEKIASADKKRLFYEKNFHLILHDTERWKACAEITQWIIDYSK